MSDEGNEKLCLSFPSSLITHHSSLLLSYLSLALLAVPRRSFGGAVRAGTSGLAAAGADELELVDADRRLALQDSTLLVLLRVGARVLLEEVHPLHDGRALGRIHAQHLALLAAVFAAENDDGVALLHVRLEPRTFCRFVLSCVHLSIDLR